MGVPLLEGTSGGGRVDLSDIFFSETLLEGGSSAVGRLVFAGDVLAEDALAGNFSDCF